jgi:hypothetical protein
VKPKAAARRPKAVVADRRPLKGSPRELSAFEAAEASEVEAAAGASLDEVNDQVVFDALGFNDARTGSQAAKAPQYLSVMA